MAKKGAGYDIVTFGSATFDVFAKVHGQTLRIKTPTHEESLSCFLAGSKVLIEELHTATGGGGTNSAVSFSRLDFKTAWLGVLSTTDEHSRIVEAELDREGVAFVGVKKRGRIGYSVILESNGDRTILTHKGIENELKLNALAALRRLRPNWLYFSTLLGPAFKSQAMAAAIAKARGICTAYNPSEYLCRQGFEALRPVIENCDILVLNKEEAALLVGEKPVPELLASLQSHVRIVVITDGPAGAYAYDGKLGYAIKPHKVRVIDTTGAGDAFASGFVAGMAKPARPKKAIEDALRLGLANAESVIQNIGAKSGLLSLAAARTAMVRKPAKLRVGELSTLAGL